MIWSPSATAPVSSSKITRSASPSRQMPTSAPVSRIFRRRRLGRGRAHGPALMLNPSGETPMATTSAPSSQSHLGRRAVGRAVGAVDHDLEPLQRQTLGKGALDPLDIAEAAVVDAPGPPDVARLRGLDVARDQRLDLHLGLVRQLEPVGAEELDPVVLGGVVTWPRSSRPHRRASNASACPPRASAPAPEAGRSSPSR